MRIRGKEILFMILMTAFASSGVNGQRYRVEKAGFSSEKYNDYSPAYFGDGLVFCSDRKLDVMVVYTTTENKQGTSMWYVSRGDDGKETVQVFSRELLTNLNDGPATFSQDGSLVYYSRNQDTTSKLRDVFDKQNKLGLYRAERLEGRYVNISPFRYNSTEYSITTPALSPDGSRLYFASDMPGGYGGADLWYCELRNQEWAEPVNLGPVINSRGNESYPFISESGILYFASDGWQGSGRKDIFYTLENDEGNWIAPVHMDGPINSKDDDFGLITDLNGNQGYFSSNRENSDNIYHFTTDIPAFHECDTLKQNFYCYLFYDEGAMEIDSLPLRYEWNFGDGEKVTSKEAEHCFPGAGRYTVELNIIDNNTGNTFFTQTSYEMEIVDEVQPYITSDDAFVRSRNMHFSGSESNLPELVISEYYWDFGDGTYSKGAEVDHMFQKQGTYRVVLGVTGAPDPAGIIPKECVYKTVNILKDNQDLAIYKARESGQLVFVPDSVDLESPNTQMLYSMQEAEAKEAVYRVELFSSETPVSFDSALFDPIRNVYEVTEVFLRKDSVYSYTVGEAASLLETYPIFSDVVNRGYENASVKSYVLAELAEEELLQLTTALGEFDDAYFEFDDYRISPASFGLLDRVVEIMNRYPGIRLEIAAHTDNMGSFEYNMRLSQKRAQSMVDYLVQKGIDPGRLVGKGYGESRPIADNNTEEGQSINRRVEFIILDERE